MNTARRNTGKMQSPSRTRGSRLIRRIAALLPAAVIAAAFTGTASASLEYQYSFGGQGAGATQFNWPNGLGLNHTTGHLYVADRNNHRIVVREEDGDFVRAWGYDVVSSGPSNQLPNNEIQRVIVPAGSGSFRLTYNNQTTPYLAYNASALDVQNALNALSSISSGGGSVTVADGPGSASGSTPYHVTFNGGPLAATNVNPMTIDSTALGAPAGTQLNCAGVDGFLLSAEWSYQWLANGEPISGATSQTLTLGAGEAGKAIQCQVTAKWGDAQLSRTNPAFTIAHPAPASPIPLTTESNGVAPMPEVGAPLNVGTAGGQPMTCNAGNWANSPTSYTYQWYRDLEPLGAPVTTSETSTQRIVTAEDLEEPHAFQCSVKATNASGSSKIWSVVRNTIPPINETIGNGNIGNANLNVTSTHTGRIGTTVQGGAPFEVCLPLDTCKAGVGGPGVGQLAEPLSVAVDNSPSGNGGVYVVERNNHRVQKFSAEGTPLLMMGSGVNQDDGSNLCVVSTGDACGGGAQSRLQPGGFGQWGDPFLQPFQFHPVQEVAVDNAGFVYVGDATLNGVVGHYGRIEKFDSGGNFVGQVRLAGTAPGTGFFPEPISVGVDSIGRVFVAVDENKEIQRFEPDQFGLEYKGPAFADRQYFASGLQVTGLAVDPTTDYIWNFDLNSFNNFLPLFNCGETGATRIAVMAWDADGHELLCDAPSGAGQLNEARGMVISEDGLMFVSTGNTGHQIKVFKLPQPEEPEVVNRAVNGITMKTAILRAQVKPGFLPTDVTFEYGLQSCASNACTEVEGNKVYGLKAQPAQATIAGLEPNTRYFYRAIAENSEGEDISVEGSFVTFRFIDFNIDDCDNVLARKQTGASPLIDCRAYELASDEFTGGYDVASDIDGRNPLPGYPQAEGRLLYTTVNGGIPGAGSPTNRGQDPYVAVRGDEGWTTEYVGIPSDSGYSTKRFASDLIGADDGLQTFAFGGPDICSPCLADETTGIPVRLPDGSLVQGMGSVSPAAEAEGYVGRSLSSDGRYLVFGTETQIVPAGNNNGDNTIYKRDLETDTTQVVSTTTGGQTITGEEVGALDLSDDGSRVVIGTAVGTDSNGNTYWHPYMHLGSTPNSVDLAPGSISGVLFNGMTSDGSRVFFTTVDQLDPGDTDESADIYEATIDGSSVDLAIVSVGSGGPSNDDSCTPAGTPNSWNTPEGDGKCGALAFAGGAGLASESGTFYFLSPEQLDGSAGELNQANLYAAEPGGSPEFVATIDTSVGKPGPPHWTNELNDTDFTNSNLETPESLTVDQATGDLYVYEKGDWISRYDSNGAPKNFTATGTNKIGDFNYPAGERTQVAFDNSGTAFDGTIFATQYQGKVKAFNRNGEEVGELTGAGNPFFGSQINPCGVAVDQSNGDVYVGEFVEPGIGLIWRYSLKPGVTFPIEQTDYTATFGVIIGQALCQLAADDGFVYAAGYPQGPTRAFFGEDFGSVGLPFLNGPIVDPGGNALSIDPVANDLYVNRGNQIHVYETANFGKVEEITEGSLVGSKGVAVNSSNRDVFASNGSKIVRYTEVPPPYHPLDNPAILHAEKSAEHEWGDFVVTPDGRFAAFATNMPLDAGFENAGHYEVYRFDNDSDALDCTSCSPTEAVPTTDASLPANGLGMTDDGRVFFNTGEQLMLRDTNEKFDAYQWVKDEETGATQQALISTGSSLFNSGMLGVTADGTDAFFFTRETIVKEEDFNGEAMKIYDARTNGGYFKLPVPPQCAAADECRGPATQAAPPPQIGSFKGSGGNVKTAPKRCRKGFVKRRGKCVRKPCRKGSVKRRGKCVKKKRSKKRTGSSRRGGNR